MPIRDAASRSISFQSSFTRTALSGFKSPCTRPCSCRCARHRPSVAAIRRAASTDMRACEMSPARSSSARSITSTYGYRAPPHAYVSSAESTCVCSTGRTNSGSSPVAAPPAVPRASSSRWNCAWCTISFRATSLPALRPAGGAEPAGATRTAPLAVRSELARGCCWWSGAAPPPPVAPATAGAGP